MPRLITSMRMSTRAELLSGLAILSASLLMHSVSAVSSAGFVRDFLGVFSVLFLMAGIGVLGVGLTHRMTRAEQDEARGGHPDTMTPPVFIASGAVIGIGIGSTVGTFNDGALGVAMGIVIGAGIGAVGGSWWYRRQQDPR